MSTRLMPGRWRLVRRGQCLGERELQHHLALLVGDHQRGGEDVGILALLLEQIDDHRLGDLPGVIGVAQLLALDVGDGVVANPGVEEVAGHGFSYSNLTAPLRTTAPNSEICWLKADHSASDVPPGRKWALSPMFRLPRSDGRARLVASFRILMFSWGFRPGAQNPQTIN